jgi:hypothetical protein
MSIPIKQQGGTVKVSLRTILRSTTILSGAALLAITTATSASATTTASHGSDRAQATQYSMRAYDGESDGNGVYADAYLANGARVPVGRQRRPR